VFCALFAFGRLKTFLNERFQFHETDQLIIAIIIGTAVLSGVALGARAFFAFGMAPRSMAVMSVVIILMIALPLAVLSIVFAVKLLRLPSTLNGLLKPYCYITIAAATCFVTLILAPIGLLLDAASNVLLGLIFLRPPEPTPEPEFV
jgi:ABC-type antimicrobial peptide transport system permease subunit